MKLRNTLADLEDVILSVEVNALAVTIIDEALDNTDYKDNDNMSILRSRAVDQLNTSLDWLRESFRQHHDACKAMQLLEVKAVDPQADVA